MPDLTAEDRLSADFDHLRAGMRLPDANAVMDFRHQVPNGAPSSRERGAIPWDTDPVRQVMDLGQAFSPYVTLSLLVPQFLFNRGQKFKLLVAEVVGVLRGLGASRREMTLIHQLAGSELRRLGLSEADALRLLREGAG